MPYRNWKRLHLASLGQSKPKLLKELSEEGRLTTHLQEVAQAAQEQFERSVTGLLKLNPGWTQSQAERSAEEAVLQDLVLVKSEETELADRVGYLD